MLSSFSNVLANSGSLADAAGAAIGGSIFLVILFWIIGIATTILWIWMLIDCLTSSLPTNEKILWALVIILLPLVGSLIYLFVVRPRGRGTTAISR